MMWRFVGASMVKVLVKCGLDGEIDGFRVYSPSGGIQKLRA